MKRILIILFIFLIIIIALFVLFSYRTRPQFLVSPLTGQNLSPTPKELSQYSIPILQSKTASEADVLTSITVGLNASDADVLNSNSAGLNASILFDELNGEDSQFNSYIFSFMTGNKKVTGTANIPRAIQNAPVILLIRGFVDPAIYEPGIGSKRAGEAFAKAGYITLAPDFLGYGESDNPSINAMEERFETYTTMLSLISSLPSLPKALESVSENKTTADTARVGIWGHSNGGHIALAILEITGKPYPTVLWAPVTKPFPYSILYYTDEYEDQGKKLRKLVADFETDYNVDEYTVTNYLDWIKAPLQIHQGGADDAVPLKWSDQFVQKLKELDKDVSYYTYPGADHNLNPSWNQAITRSISFFQKNL